MIGYFRRGVQGVAVLALVCSLAIPARADEEGDNGAYRLEGVTVSAQKREENVQEIPLSVGVLTDARLDEERITELYDLDKVIPNLYIANSGGTGSYTYLGIRGRINGDADVDPTVTVLVDGVPYDDFYSMGNNLLYDVERVEVLRGPQSTIYGMNSIAGVINIVTRKPGETRRVKVYGEGAAGPDWDGTWQAGGSLSGPLVDDALFGGLSLMVKSQGGYIKNTRTDDLYNSDRTMGMRGNLRWTPNTAWEMSFGMAYTDYDADYSETYLPTTRAAASHLGLEFKKWEIDTDWEGKSEVKTLAPSLNVKFDGGSYTVTSISAYRNSRQEFDFNPYVTTGGTLGVINHDANTFTQELRLQSDAGESSNLEWMGGYFLNVFERDMQLGWALTSSPSAKTYFKDSKLKGVSNAFFGQATYRFLDKALGLTAGARGEWTEREGKSRKGLFDEKSINDSQFLPKIALDYRFSPQVMAYASVTKGWRCGGVNPLANNNSQATYDNETSWTYEIGAKTTLFDGRMKFNTSAFYTKYEDYQDKIYVTAGTAYLTNAPEVRMMGLETELEAQLTPSVLLIGSFGYVNAEYEDFPDATYGNFDGNKVMFVPDFDANLAVKYSFLEHFYIRPEVQIVGNLYWNRENTEKQTPYALFNIKAGYTRDNYEIYLYGENLTNQYKFSQATDYLSNGDYYGTPITPLRIGIGANVEF